MNDDFLLDDIFIEPTSPTQEGSDTASLLPSTLDPIPTRHAVTLSNSINKWDPRLILDLALGIEDTLVVLDRYDLTREDYESLMDNHLFRRELASMMRDIQENGTSFRSKAKIQAESYLPILDEIACDVTVPSSVRLQAIRDTVRWGDLEPRKDAAKDEGPATQINVQICF